MADQGTKDDGELWPPETVIALAEPFTDERGVIQPLVDLTIQSAAVITSNKGAIRANHHHKTDWHYCYVISGSIEYFHRPTGSTKPPEKIVIKAGEMFFTPPMVDHAMRFPVETVFLTMSRNPRDKESYESDVVRISLI
ncbi:MAG: cupin domain-containing protein [Proteobacteria bacterium]|nr:cupin domain-containing protein [Pseudomonadota bacterium]